MHVSISSQCTHLVYRARCDARHPKPDKIKLEKLSLTAIPDIKFQKFDRSCNRVEY